MQSKFTKEYVLNIDDKIPQIIEYFVEFYGENFREEITQKLNNTRFVFVGDDQDLLNFIEYKNQGCENLEQILGFIQEKIEQNEARRLLDLKNTQQHIQNLVDAIVMYIKSEHKVDLSGKYRDRIENALQTQSALDVSSLISYYTNCLKKHKEPSLYPTKSELYYIDPNNILGSFVYKISSLDSIKSMIKKSNREISSLINHRPLLINDTLKELAPLEQDLATCEYKEMLDVANMPNLFGDHCTALHMTALSKSLDKINNIIFIKATNTLVDNVLIHELMHAVETHVQKGENGAVSFGSGLNSQTRHYNGDSVMLDHSSIDSREEQILDEVLTDWRASKISDKMYEDGFEIFNNSEYSLSIYAECFTACDKLFTLIQDKINQYSFYGKKSSFIEYLGRENYYKLARACSYMALEDIEPDIQEIKAENPTIEYDDQLLDALDTITTDNKYIASLKAIKEVTQYVEQKIKLEKDVK